MLDNVTPVGMDGGGGDGTSGAAAAGPTNTKLYSINTTANTIYVINAYNIQVLIY